MFNLCVSQLRANHSWNLGGIGAAGIRDVSSVICWRRPMAALHVLLAEFLCFRSHQKIVPEDERNRNNGEANDQQASVARLAPTLLGLFRRALSVLRGNLR